MTVVCHFEFIEFTQSPLGFDSASLHKISHRSRNPLWNYVRHLELRIFLSKN